MEPATPNTLASKTTKVVDLQKDTDAAFQVMLKSLGLSAELLKPDNSNYASVKLDFETFKKQIES